MQPFMEGVMPLALWVSANSIITQESKNYLFFTLLVQVEHAGMETFITRVMEQTVLL